jgi:hypothetical protein
MLFETLPQNVATRLTTVPKYRNYSGGASTSTTMMMMDHQHVASWMGSFSRPCSNRNSVGWRSSGIPTTNVSTRPCTLRAMITLTGACGCGPNAGSRTACPATACSIGSTIVRSNLCRRRRHPVADRPVQKRRSFKSCVYSGRNLTNEIALTRWNPSMPTTLCWSSSSVRVALSCSTHQIICANLAQAYSLGHIVDRTSPLPAAQRPSAHATRCSPTSATPTPSSSSPPDHASRTTHCQPTTTASRQPNYVLRPTPSGPRLPGSMEHAHANRNKTNSPHVINASNFGA